MEGCVYQPLRYDGRQYETVKDYAEELQRKYNIEFDWDSIDEVIGLNQNHKKQLCEIKILEMNDDAQNGEKENFA